MSKPTVRSTQTMYLSCINISTISKQAETSFHLNLVTYRYHQVRPKWFLNLWYIYRKPCTYLALKLTRSPNGKKWDSTWPTSLRSFIGCVQNDGRANGTFDANALASRLALSPNRPKQAFTWASSPRSTIGCVGKDFWADGTFGANRAPILHQH
jgi:hypothetical protein